MPPKVTSGLVVDIVCVLAMNLNNKPHFILFKLVKENRWVLLLLFFPHSQNNPYSLHHRSKGTMYPLWSPRWGKTWDYPRCGEIWDKFDIKKDMVPLKQGDEENTLREGRVLRSLPTFWIPEGGSSHSSITWEY